ncbi:MAG: response regulator transcription factor [Anaerolineaceae bacterium]|nr:response regulator transcription factor [Anaerolineaceae bacterium]
MDREEILIVDDEKNILDLSCLYLEREGFSTLTAQDGLQAYQMITAKQPDFVVLDVMLPGLDGFELCKKLRAEGITVPILMLTARDEDIDKILGLELGADDYMTKPFNPRELVARVKAILRRGEILNQNAQKSEVLKMGNVILDPQKREVRVNEIEIPLRTQEFEVLWIFFQHPGFVLSRDKLLQLAWGYDFAGQTRTVDVHVAQLRKKLSNSQISIETVSGIGYKCVKKV